MVNTRSRSGERLYPRALTQLRDLGVPVVASYAVPEPARLAQTVREALCGNPDLIILGGGDGSVSCVVDLLAGQDTVLAVLPLGTGNDFARTLGIPFDLRHACELIVHGKIVDVDLGLVGQDYYVNAASVGLGVAVSRALTPALKQRLGAAAYPAAAVRAFLRHEPFRATLTFPAGDQPPATFDRLLQVAVGNGRFHGGGMVVAPSAGIDDGTLDVYALELGARRDLARLARYFKTGEFIRSECVSHFRTRAVRLETDPPLPINVDGEVVGRTPQTFSLAPNALKVLVPMESVAAEYHAALDRPYTGRD